MKKGELLFVYGTLRRGESADLGAGRHRSLVDYIGDDIINGELYDLGPYPGAKVKPGLFKPDSPHIVGNVYRLRSESIIGMLDAYEGYPTLYGRVQTMTNKGRQVWVYVYQHEVLPLQRLECGDWQRRDMPASVQRMMVGK
jgi:gamma-glutamylcyclotransferase (GGCT)/AIG2-like uncharacterized protein YtfP